MLRPTCDDSLSRMQVPVDTMPGLEFDDTTEIAA